MSISLCYNFFISFDFSAVSTCSRVESDNNNGDLLEDEY